MSFYIYDLLIELNIVPQSYANNAFINQSGAVGHWPIGRTPVGAGLQPSGTVYFQTSIGVITTAIKGPLGFDIISKKVLGPVTTTFTEIRSLTKTAIIHIVTTTASVIKSTTKSVLEKITTALSFTEGKSYNKSYITSITTNLSDIKQTLKNILGPINATITDIKSITKGAYNSRITATNNNIKQAAKSLGETITTRVIGPLGLNSLVKSLNNVITTRVIGPLGTDVISKTLKSFGTMTNTILKTPGKPFNSVISTTASDIKAISRTLNSVITAVASYLEGKSYGRTYNTVITLTATTALKQISKTINSVITGVVQNTKAINRTISQSITTGMSNIKQITKSFSQTVVIGISQIHGVLHTQSNNYKTTVTAITSETKNYLRTMVTNINVALNKSVNQTGDIIVTTAIAAIAIPRKLLGHTVNLIVTCQNVLTKAINHSMNYGISVLISDQKSMTKSFLSKIILIPQLSRVPSKLINVGAAITAFIQKTPGKVINTAIIATFSVQKAVSRSYSFLTTTLLTTTQIKFNNRVQNISFIILTTFQNITNIGHNYVGTATIGVLSTVYKQTTKTFTTIISAITKNVTWLSAETIENAEFVYKQVRKKIRAIFTEE